jgi:hypothetical protein
VVGTVSPIREEVDNAADELSVLGDGPGTARKTLLSAPTALNGTPVSIHAEEIATETPIANSARDVRSGLRRSIQRTTTTIRFFTC